MQRLVILLALIPATAVAQEKAVPVPMPLLLHTIQCLQIGCSYAENTAVAQTIVDTVNEPQKAAERKAAEDKRVADAVAAAKQEKASP
jgi:hypothetical protein